MQIPYELILGWRYTRAGRATRRNGFISFISGVRGLAHSCASGLLSIHMGPTLAADLWGIAAPREGAATRGQRVRRAWPSKPASMR